MKYLPDIVFTILGEAKVYVELYPSCCTPFLIPIVTLRKIEGAWDSVKKLYSACRCSFFLYWLYRSNSLCCNHPFCSKFSGFIILVIIASKLNILLETGACSLLESLSTYRLSILLDYPLDKCYATCADILRLVEKY